MHLTQQQQLNQMCPPPLGPPAAWFMNPQSTTGLPPPQTTTSYHSYHHPHHHHNTHHQQPQNYYDINTGHSIPPPSGANLHNSSTTTATTTVLATNLAISTNNITVSQQNHLQHHHHHQQHSHHHQQQQQTSQYSYPYHHSQTTQLQRQPQHQHQNSQQQYNQIHHHQQPLTIQQPQSQLVHQPQQPSPLSQQTQPQLSPHTTSQPRPSPTLLQHQQTSPNYQQHSPHLTSPSLQPSPVLHHQTQQQQHSPLGHHQQHTPPHHTPTPLSQHHNSRPASVKEVTSTTTTIHQLSNILQTEVRILELNRRLQCRPTTCYRTNPLPSHDQYDDLTWWDEFINDFFKDDAILTLIMQVDEKPVKYVLRRALISRFFRSYFDGGVTELSINLKNSKELRGSQSIVLECEHANIITKNILKHPKINSSPRVVVCTEGHLSLEFVGNSLENLMIKSWKFKINLCREYIDRSITAIGLPNTLLIEPITFQGLPNTTMFYLRMCSIMEPMQDIMAQHKLTNIEPRACLKKLLFDRYRFMSEDDNKTSEIKRRKRKQPNSPATVKASNASKKSRASMISCNNLVNGTSLSATTSLPPISIVGEPSPMGEYRDDNERLIKQIENSNHIPVEDSENKPEISSEPVQKDDIKEESKEGSNDENSQQTDNIEREEINIKIEQTERYEKEVETDPVSEAKPASQDEELPALIEEPSRPLSEEPSEKENNGSALNEETQMNSTATQSENQFNIMNSIPEDKEDTCKSTSSDSIVSKLPPSSNSKSAVPTNGSTNKQNRRRSSERKETLREGLMRTSDFVIAMKDLKCEHPALWRITTGNNLLQQFEPKTQNGVVLYENTNQYAGWNPEIKRDYIGIDVRLTQHTRNQITVERLLLNFQKLDDAEAFYDKHFAIYLQILISTALDPKFWEGIEGEPKHHDYFVTSRKIIDDTTKRYKLKLANKLKLNEAAMKNIEKYPSLLIKPIDKDEKAQPCRNCNTSPSTQLVTFGNKTYDLHSFKTVKVTSGQAKTDDKDQQNSLCDACLEVVKLYSEVHHMGWKFYKLASRRVERHLTAGKPINNILDECMKDEDWMAKVYTERDLLWSRVEQAQ